MVIQSIDSSCVFVYLFICLICFVFCLFLFVFVFLFFFSFFLGGHCNRNWFSLFIDKQIKKFSPDRAIGSLILYKVSNFAQSGLMMYSHLRNVSILRFNSNRPALSPFIGQQYFIEWSIANCSSLLVHSPLMRRLKNIRCFD